MEFEFYSAKEYLKIFLLLGSTVALYFWCRGLFSTKVKLHAVNMPAYIISLVWKSWMKELDVVPLHCRIFMRINAACKLSEKDGMFELNLVFRRLTCVCKAEFMKILLNHSAAQGKSWEYAVLENIFGSGLLAASSEKARHHRKIVSPAFHLQIMRDYIEVFNEKSVLLVSKLKKIVNEPWVYTDEYVKECTLAVICQTGMGLEVERNKEVADFLDAVDVVMSITVARMVQPWTHNDFIFQFFPNGRKLWKHYNEGIKFCERVIKESKELLLLKRKNQSINENYGKGRKTEKMPRQRKNFTQLLLESQMTDESFTSKDLRDEVLTFIMAGVETLSVGINITLIMLGLYRDVQETAIKEIDSIFKDDLDKFATFEDIKQMQYLECVIKESLRLYPPGPMVAREITEDIQLGTCTIPRGSGVFFNLYMLHRDPECFPNPEKFDPERFLPENAKNRHPYAFMAFSAGARNCIGQKFAVAEMKCIISHILRNFRVEALENRDVMNFSWDLTLRTLKPYRLKFIPRHLSISK